MRLSELICLAPKQKYFCKRGWTDHFGKHEVICPSGRIGTTRLSVVPANAGTHTPRPHFLAQWLTASAPTNDGGYGSSLSRGRQNTRFNFQTARTVLHRHCEQYRVETVIARSQRVARMRRPMTGSAKQSIRRLIPQWIASSRSLSPGPPKAGPVGSSQ